MTTQPDDEEQKSRSQVKREFKERKALVRQLVALPPNQFQMAHLSDSIREAVLAARDLTRSALKRQISYIVGRLQEEDVTSIQAILSGESPQEPEDTAVVPESQRWGDELISGSDQMLELLIEHNPGLDIQHLRQLVRNARKERALHKPGKSTRQLFEYLESLNGEVS